jgi:UDP-N-acetylmuramyl pentapeptide phosphotransferase/UDP-N-acetylglucosamine-1-phosphate transferase
MAGRIVLGDVGIYSVTIVFGIRAMCAPNKWGVSVEAIAVWFFIPIMDCVRLMIARTLRGQVPSNGDRNHFHRRLQDPVEQNYALMIYLGTVGATLVIAALRPGMSPACLMLLVAFYFSFAWLDQRNATKELITTTSLKDAGVRLTGRENVVLHCDHWQGSCQTPAAIDPRSEVCCSLALDLARSVGP